MKIERVLQGSLKSQLGRNKVLVLVGARRVGKTFLLDQLESSYEGKVLRLNGDLPETHQLLSSQNIQTYTRILDGANLLFIDEAQEIPNIGKILKILIDHFKQLTILATGSSSFELSNRVGEPLTGRQITYHLYPVWQGELTPVQSPVETIRNLEDRLIYGSYPEVITLQTDADRRQYLQELTSSYLLKDILIYESIRNSHKLLQLLQLIAHQVGQEVSLQELANQLVLSKDTVSKYLDLLCKVFIIYRIGAFSSNLRKEIVKSSKWYFTDNGIRNALINNFASLEVRNDVGVLWENYLMAERIKFNAYSQNFSVPYFWRTYDQQEIDLIEVADGKVKGFEFKWGNRKSKPPLFFTKSYPHATYQVINKENYLDFIE
ncbi:MAG: ATP-binding protein [Cyclobacteriaceae bacterium]|nr:ATP-binding protein [Cyclobacteriaceae bacterium]